MKFRCARFEFLEETKTNYDIKHSETTYISDEEISVLIFNELCASLIRIRESVAVAFHFCVS